MDENEFYDYVVKNYVLDGTSSRLVRNIIEYVKDMDIVDEVDAHAHLESLLDGAFGIERHEIRRYRAEEGYSAQV